MQKRSPSSFTWTDVLAGLRSCTGEPVLIRDGKLTEPAAAVQNRPSAKGTELCLVSGEGGVKRTELIEKLHVLAKTGGRRFMTSARARIGQANLVVEGVADEDIDGVLCAVVRTRRPKLGFNRSEQIGDSTTLRSKRIKNG